MPTGVGKTRRRESVAPALPATVLGRVVPQTAAPLTLLAADAGEAWVAACLASRDTNGDGRVGVEVDQRGQLHGDELVPHLLRDEKAPIVFDEWVGGDPSGRFILSVERGGLWLRDLVADESWNLSERGATTRTDTAPFLPHRSGEFSPTGNHLVYLIGAVGQEQAVIRDLRDGSEHTVAPPRGKLWRATFDETGRWVVLHVSDIDSNGDGEIQWPYELAASPRSGCRAPVATYQFRPFRPADVPAPWLVPIEGGEPRRVQRFVASFGDGWLRRRSDRAIFWERPGEASVLISRSACNGRALHVDPRRLLLVVACEGEDHRRSVELVGPGLHHEVNAAVDDYEFDRLRSSGSRLVALKEGHVTHVLDLWTKSLRPLERRDRVLGSFGTTLAVARKDLLLVGEPGSLQPVGKFDRLGPVLRQGELLWVPPYVIDLAAGESRGRVEGQGLAVSSRGRVLTPSVPEGALELAVGPLIWQEPRQYPSLEAAAAPYGSSVTTGGL